MKRQNLLGIDFETTGLKPGYHGIVSLGISHATLQRHWRVIPHREAVISPEAIAVNGYSPERWKELNAQPMSVVMREVAAVIASLDEPVRVKPLAHGAGFDRAWFDWMAEYTGIEHGLDRRWACSQAAMQYLMDAGIIPPGSCSLDSLCDRAGLKRESSVHHAGEDADLSRRGYLWMTQQVARPSFLVRMLRRLQEYKPFA